MKRAPSLRVNLIASAILFLGYTAWYLVDRGRGGGIPFLDYMQTAGTLLLISGLLGWWMESPYYLGLALFAMAAQFGGSMLRLYAKLPHFDLALHGCSGVLLVLLGHYTLSLPILRRPGLRLPPSVTYAFCWFFSVAWAGIWEVLEFALDLLIPGNNSQPSLLDTMTDLCAGTAGAFAGLALLWLLLRQKARQKTD